MGGKTATTTSQVQIPEEVLARYNAVNARAEATAAMPFQAYTGEFVAPMNEYQLNALQGLGALSDQVSPYFEQAASLAQRASTPVGQLTQADIMRYYNPYTESVIDPTMEALRQQQAEQQAGTIGNAIMSNAFGGDRSGLGLATLARQQSLASAMTEGQLRQAAYNQAVQTAAGQQQLTQADLARQAQLAQTIGGLGAGVTDTQIKALNAAMQGGTLAQQTRQALDTAQYQQFLQERGYPFQVAQFLANIAMGTGALSGSTTTTEQPVGWWSDERLKDNIEPIGKTFDDQPIYRFDYGDGRTQVGLLAQDVEQAKPEAVGLMGGYKTVDYDKATEDAASLGKMASMGGAVDLGSAGEEFARGGYVVGGGILEGNADLSRLLEQQRQFFGPFGQAGLYGGGGGGKSMGWVPAASLPVRALNAPRTPPQSNRNVIAEAAQTGKAIESLFGMGQKGYQSVFGKDKKEQQRQQPQTAANTDSQPEQAQGVGAGAPARSTPPAAQQTSDLGSAVPASEPAPIQVAEIMPPVDELAGLGGMFAASGGRIREGFAGGGVGDAKPLNPVNPYDIEDPMKDPLEGLLEDQSKQSSPSLKPAETPPPQQGPSPMSLISPIVGLFSMFSDERLKHNVEPIGKTFDGQPVYKYDFGDGRTRMGLMAQDVLQDHPEAVGMRNNYLTVDYDKATERAARLARDIAYAGGRQGYQVGGSPEEADLPAVGAQEAILGLSEDNPLSQLARGIGSGVSGVGSAITRGLGAAGSALSGGAGGEPAKPEARRVQYEGGLGAGRAPERPGSFQKIGEKVLPTSFPKDADFWVPTLAGIGSMLASRNPTLLGTIGEGLVGGTAAYEQRQTGEQARNLSRAEEQTKYANLASSSIMADQYQRMWRRVLDKTTGQFKIVPESEYRSNTSKYEPQPLDQESMQQISRMPSPEKPASPPQGARQAPSTSGQAGAAASPAGGQPSETKVGYTQLSKADKEAIDSASQRFQAQPADIFASPETLKSMNPFNDIQKSADAVISSENDTRSLYRSIAKLGDTGLTSTGRSQEVLGPIRDFVTSIFRNANIPITDKDLDNRTAAIEAIRKSSALLAQRYGQESVQALQNALSAIPGEKISPQGNAVLISGMAIDRRRQLDLQEFSKNWKDYARDKLVGAKPNQEVYTGEKLIRNFYDRTQNNYMFDRSAIQKIWNEKIEIPRGDGTKYKVTYGYLLTDPKIVSDPYWSEKINKFAKTNVTRYFGGN